MLPTLGEVLGVVMVLMGDVFGVELIRHKSAHERMTRREDAPCDEIKMSQREDAKI